MSLLLLGLVSRLGHSSSQRGITQSLHLCYTVICGFLIFLCSLHVENLAPSDSFAGVFALLCLVCLTGVAAEENCRQSGSSLDGTTKWCCEKYRTLPSDTEYLGLAGACDNDDKCQEVLPSSKCAKDRAPDGTEYNFCCVPKATESQSGAAFEADMAESSNSGASVCNANWLGLLATGTMLAVLGLPLVG